MKRYTKIILGSIITLGLIGVVAAKQFGGYGHGNFADHMAKRISHKLDLNATQQTELDKLKTSLQAKFKQRHAERPPIEDILNVMQTKLAQGRRQS